MPEFSAWLAGVKERLEKATFPGVDHLIRRGDEDATDLALAVRALEAVERFEAQGDDGRADLYDLGFRDAVWLMKDALHSAFEETKA